MLVGQGSIGRIVVGQQGSIGSLLVNQQGFIGGILMSPGVYRSHSCGPAGDNM